MVPMAIIIKNERAAGSITFPEIGEYVLEAGHEVDIRPYYANPDAPMRALYVLEGTELFQRRDAGDISVRVMYTGGRL